MAQNGFHNASVESFDFDEDMDPTLYFEKGRIQQLQDERVQIQKKTFTKWCNSFLNRARMEIIDLFADVGDGVMLMKLLEIISGDKLGKPNRGRMRVQKIENLNRVLEFLKRKKIQLENIGAEDILDRNERLILGLIWTIILRFQIEEIEIDVGEEEQTGEKRRAKDALLLWCQRKTAGYPHVKIENFSSSWRNGLGFNALIHAHRPDLLEYNALNPHDHIANLNNAFDTAEKKLGIARLLDAEDVDVNRPDEKSVMTYVTQYYHYFAKQKTELTGARRVAKVLGQLMSTDQLRVDYDQLSTTLLEWIRHKIADLSDRHFPNSLKGIQEETIKFKQYRTVEKPPKYKEKGELEALYFTIQTKQKAMGTKVTTNQSTLLHLVESEWDELESAEHARQVALHEQLVRQERLEQLSRKFERKAKLRDSWLREMTAVLEDFDFGTNAAQVEASLKKHEAISADILPREDRFRNLSVMAGELWRENFHGRERVRAREKEIVDKWAMLLDLLERRRGALMALNDLMSMLRDIDTLSHEFTLLEPSVKSRDMGKHVMGVEDLVEKHELIETQIVAQGEWLKNIEKQSQEYIRNKGEQYELLQRKLDDLRRQYDSLVEQSSGRRAGLERARQLYQFIQDHEEEEGWIAEKYRVCVNMLGNKDLAVTPQLQRLYTTLETERVGHWNRTKEVLATGETLLPQLSGNAREEVQQRIQALQERWDELKDLSALLNKCLREARQASHYFQDANEAESWMREKMPLAGSDDFGKDESSAGSLLSRHVRLEEEIGAYKADIERLDEMAHELARAEYVIAHVHDTNDDEQKGRLLKVLYKYEGHGLTVHKGEVLSLVQKSNSDWWRIKTDDGTEGFVPANYVREVDSDQSEKSKDTPPEEEINPILHKQEQINKAYGALNKLAQTRRRYLEDAIKLYRFYRECDEFEVWAKETEILLHEEPSIELVEASRKKFDKLMTDIVANGGTQLKAINEMADALIRDGHSQKEHIRRRQIHASDLWKSLLRQRDLKAKALETAESVAAFNQTCEETRAWMNDKFELLDQAADAKDLKALQALQRGHQNLERELRPVEEKMALLKELAEQVKAAYPAQADAIDRKLEELQKMWMELNRRAMERRRLLEETQGQQMFQSAIKDLLSWIEKTKSQLSDDTKSVDVATAEQLLEKHYELKEDVLAHDDEFAYVQDLGHRLLEKSPGLNDVQDSLSLLSAEQVAVHELCALKEARLKAQLELELFNREADYIDAATKGHEAFLDLPDLGNSVDEVENLVKSQKEFAAKLAVQDERLGSFMDSAQMLVNQTHSQSPYISDRSQQVYDARQSVKDKAGARKIQLSDALQFQNFRRDADELSIWIDEKRRLAEDTSYKDGTNLERKLQKHEAFEAELRANADRLDKVNEDGTSLIKSDHFARETIGSILENLNFQWHQLWRVASERGAKLRQACDQKGLNHTLEDAHQKLNEMETALGSDDLGADLRGVKRLIQRHILLEQEMALYKTRIDAIVKQGEQMARAGHFDADRIVKSVGDFTKRFDSLQEPAARRRAQLEESRKLHQCLFDIDCELQWIAEKRPIAASLDTGRSLTETTNLNKKHEKLESEVTSHASIINETLSKAQQLLDENHFASDQIDTKATQLKDSWKELQQLVAKRRDALDLALKAQLYLFDAAEVESWMMEKRSILSSDDYGQDEDAANKLLTRHKALQVDMNTYKTWLENLSKTCDSLSSAGHPDSASLCERQADLERQLSELCSLAERRRRHLEDAVCLFEYLRESHELEAWINAQLQLAMSEDYGHDYEHLMELVNRFEDFKQNVKTGSERFVLCEQAAKHLLDRSPPFSGDILQRQEQLRAAWSLLLDYIENRDQKLEAAEEIHRFNRDASDALARIQEKLAAIPEDLGKDVNTVQTLLRKHEAFENELAALEAQLQVLLEDSARLCQLYPGGNAEHILTQQQALAEGWQQLQVMALERRDKLNAAYDLHRFLATARDLMSWTSAAQAEMQTEQTVRGLAGAQLLLDEHARLRAELLAREADFNALADTADLMIQADHYCKEEIADKINQVEQCRDQAMNEWQLRQQFLLELVDWHAFERDAKLLLTAITTHEATLKSSALDMSSVWSVEQELKKYETFVRLLETMEERVKAVDAEAVKLIQNNNMESDKIGHLRKEIARHWEALQKALDVRKGQLQRALLYARFNENVVDMHGWMEERRKRLAQEAETQGQLANVEEKMKRLQKHQAFEAELSANEPRIQQIENEALALSSAPEKSEPEIVAKHEQLLGKWQQLVAASQEQSRALGEARDLLDFNQLCERVLAWIRRKELMIQAAEVGEDYEHCEALMKKLDDAGMDSAVDEQTINKINKLGQKLVSQGRSESANVQEQLDDLNRNWQAVRGGLVSYRNALLAALEVHSFNRDVDDTNGRISEKATLLGAEDHCKDLNTVEALIRKQDEIERDMTAIHEKLKEHDTVAQELLGKNPPLRDTIIESLKKLEQSWDRLTQLAHTRRERLLNWHTLHKYLDAAHKTEVWASGIRNRMGSYAQPNSVSQAQALIDSHKEKLAEIEGRQHDLTSLREFGHKLLDEQPQHKGEISRSNKKLSSLEQEVQQAWTSENHRLWRCHDLQLFKDQVAMAEAWLASKEAFLKQEDLGDSIDSVDSLLKKQEHFEQAVQAQSEKVQQLKQDAETLAEKNPENQYEIEEQKDRVLKRHAALLEKCSKRCDMLKDSHQLHSFLKTCHELISWINAKLQIAYDESYLDSTNLQSKLQKHQAFDAELQANQSRIDAVNEEGKSLIDRDHFAKEQIELQLSEIKNGWQELMSKSELKTERLKQAYEAHQFNRRLEDLDKWLDVVESRLASEDHGKDLQSVENLIKKHETLAQDIVARQSQVVEANEMAEKLLQADHFMGEELKNKSDIVSERYHSLKEPCQIRHDNLQDSQRLYQWLKEAEEESVWIRERLPQVNQTSTGDNLQAVQRLNKKHQALEQEIQTHDPVFQRVKQDAEKMMTTKHFALTQITGTLTELLKLIDELKSKASVRGQRLRDALESEQYYTEASEAEQWMRDRMPLVTSGELGKDKDSAQWLLRKLETVEHDVEVERKEINRLGGLVNDMTARGHFDSAQMSAKQSKLEKDYAELNKLCQQRRTKLIDAANYYGFLHQTDDLIGWLKDKETAAASEDYGRDLDDCLQLIDSFEQLVRELAGAGERVASVQRAQEDLLRAGHPYSASIKAKYSDLQQLWSEVNEAATERQQALHGAKQVHKFDNEADETLNWLQEKEATQVVADQEDLSQADLHAIKSLLERHIDFTLGVRAVERRVRELCLEAERLVAQFPNTQEHLQVRRDEMEEQLKDVLDNTQQRQEKLNAAQQLQAYFQEYRELMAWISQMQSQVSSESLPRDVSGCESLMQRHLEYKAEIKARHTQIHSFINNGNDMLRNNHVLGEQIQNKVTSLSTAYSNLESLWEQRKTIYEENLDAQLWKRDAQSMEGWLAEREASLDEDWRQCESVEALEDCIRQFDDFLTTLHAQAHKFEALNKLTLLEQTASSHKTIEIQKQAVDAQRKEKQRKEQIKTVEKHKILAERRQERERRKTQEISLLRPIGGEDAAPKIKRQDSEPGIYKGKEEISVTPATSKEQIIPLSTAPQTVTPVVTAKPPTPTTARATPLAATSASTSSQGAEAQRKTPRRTPTFTTRRAQSLKKVRQWDDLAQIETHGHLDRKQELQSGAKKATIRSWKNYYTILCGQLLCFFKDEESFMENMAAAPPVYILSAKCEPVPDYQKRKHTFRLCTADGAEYLMSAPNEQTMRDWVAKIAFHAALPPSLQLKSFDDKSKESVPQPPLSGPPLSPSAADPSTPRRHTLTGGEDTDRHPSNADSGFLSPTDAGRMPIPSVSDQEFTPPHSPPPPIPASAPPALQNGHPFVNGFHSTEPVVNGYHSTRSSVHSTQVNGEQLYRTSITVSYSSQYTAGGDESRVNGSRLEDEDSFETTEPPPVKARAPAAPSKSSTLPPNTSAEAWGETRSASLKPQPPPRANKNGDFVAWTEEGRVTPDSAEKRGSKRISFGSLFKGKKHRESKDYGSK